MLLSSHGLILKKRKIFQRLCKMKYQNRRINRTFKRSKLKITKTVKENVRTAVQLFLKLKSYKEENFSKHLFETFYVYATYLKFKINNNTMFHLENNIIYQLKQNFLKIIDKDELYNLLRNKRISQHNFEIKIKKLMLNRLFRFRKHLGEIHYKYEGKMQNLIKKKLKKCSNRYNSFRDEISLNETFQYKYIDKKNRKEYRKFTFEKFFPYSKKSKWFEEKNNRKIFKLSNAKGYNSFSKYSKIRFKKELLRTYLFCEKETFTQNFKLFFQTSSLTEKFLEKIDAFYENYTFS